MPPVPTVMPPAMVIVTEAVLKVRIPPLFTVMLLQLQVAFIYTVPEQMVTSSVDPGKVPGELVPPQAVTQVEVAFQLPPVALE